MRWRRLPPWHRTHLCYGDWDLDLAGLDDVDIRNNFKTDLPTLGIADGTLAIFFFEVLKIFAKCFLEFHKILFAKNFLCYFSLFAFDLFLLRENEMLFVSHCVSSNLHCARCQQRRRRRRFRRFVWFTHCCFGLPALRCARTDRWCCCDCTFQHCFAYCAPHLPANVVVLHVATATATTTSSPMQLRAGSACWPQGTARVYVWVFVCVWEQSCGCCCIDAERNCSVAFCVLLASFALHANSFLPCSCPLSCVNSLLYSLSYALLIRIDCRQTFTFVFSCAVSC